MPTVRAPDRRFGTPYVVLRAADFRDIEYLLADQVTISNTLQENNTYILFFHNVETAEAQRRLDTVLLEIADHRRKSEQELETLIGRTLTPEDQLNIQYSFIDDSFKFRGPIATDVRRARLRRAIVKSSGAQTLELTDPPPPMPPSE